jgi:hypothetical protein
MKAIFKFEYDAGRMGTLSGIFVAEKEEINDLIASKKHVYFGEVLGKHSDVQGCIEADEIIEVTDDADAVAQFEKYNLSTGYNPLDYLGEEDEDEEQDEE